MKKNEIGCYQQDIENATAIEIYRSLSNSVYPHTDSIEYISDNIEDIPDICLAGMYISLMGEKEYNETILANAGESFCDLYEEDDKVLVIVLPNNCE